LLSGKPRRAGGACALSALCAAALLLSGCGANDNDPGPGGVTVGEARALDRAAEMLDEQRLPAQAPPTAAPSASETPARG
jgi:hypothetical protein